MIDHDGNTPSIVLLTAMPEGIKTIAWSAKAFLIVMIGIGRTYHLDKNNINSNNGISKDDNNQIQRTQYDDIQS